MDRRSYEEQMQKVQAKIQTSERLEYWHGFQRGLMRQYHGETVVSTDEHIEWLTYLDEPSTREKGEGYWDGLLA